MFNVAIKITIRTICKNCELVVVGLLERTDFVLYYITKRSLFSLKLVVQIGTSLFKSTASLLCGTELDRGNSGLMQRYWPGVWSRLACVYYA